MSSVLDASAILAVLGGESGQEIVAPLLEDAMVCSVNVAEVVGKLAERGGSLANIRNALLSLGLTVVDFDSSLAERAGMMRAETRSQGLSLGDRACLALAERERLPVFTSDRRWLGAIPGVNVELIR